MSRTGQLGACLLHDPPHTSFLTCLLPFCTHRTLPHRRGREGTEHLSGVPVPDRQGRPLPTRVEPRDTYDSKFSRNPLAKGLLSIFS